jgi:hypothetical protein
MVYNRMKAKPVKGECCSSCGEEGLPMVKTRCCDKWICCDTAFLSFRGGGFCNFEHEKYSMCYFHYNEGHLGERKDCEECKDFFGDEFKAETNEL